MVDLSIIIPTYEATESLKETIDSVVTQAGVVVQIVVIEDGSSLPSLALLESYFADYLGPNAKVDNTTICYRIQRNTGAYLARLNALKYCTGKYIKFLDQDDLLLKGTLAREVLAFESNVDVVLSSWFTEQKTQGADGVTRIETNLIPAPTLGEPIDDFLAVGGVFTSAALYRSSIAKSALIPVKNFIPVKADDWLIFAQVCLHGARYKTIKNTAYIWKQSEQQLSKFSRNNLVFEHYNILSWIESQLTDSNRLTQNRKKLLANYYAKQLIESYQLNDGSFEKLTKKIKRLVPSYKQQHGNSIYRFSCYLLGLTVGVKLYTKMVVFYRKLITIKSCR